MSECRNIIAALARYSLERAAKKMFKAYSISNEKFAAAIPMAGDERDNFPINFGLTIIGYLAIISNRK